MKFNQRHSIFLLVILLCFVSCRRSESNLQSDIIVLEGGTILDFDDFGQSDQDRKNSVIIIKDGMIKKLGEAGKINIPKQAKRIDISDKWVVPGLIDAFSTLNDQGYANSFLYNGVTSIVGLDGGRRGNLFKNAVPSPEIIPFDSYWGGIWSTERQQTISWKTKTEIKADIDSISKSGVKVLLVHYGVKPNQLKTIIEECRKRNMVTIGELGHSYVRDAIDAGIHSFVHTSRYSVDIIPENLREPYKTASFGKPRDRMYEYYESFSPKSDSALMEHAKMIGQSKVGLIPTFSIFYPSFPFAKNPWESPSAGLINVDSVHLPVSKKTGKWKALKNTESWDTLVWSQNLVLNLLEIEKQYSNRDAKYLTGTGTDAFGALPGISIHSELEMLTKAGLSNREALAAATTNFCEIFGWNHIGQIKEGCEADILVLNENPLDNLNNLKSIYFLLLNGKRLNKQELLTYQIE